MTHYVTEDTPLPDYKELIGKFVLLTTMANKNKYKEPYLVTDVCHPDLDSLIGTQCIIRNGELVVPETPRYKNHIVYCNKIVAYCDTFEEVRAEMNREYHPPNNDSGLSFKM